MFDYKHLNNKYMNDPAFNKAVNLFVQLIKEYGFLPSEIREAIFLAQYKYETTEVVKIIQTAEELKKIEEARLILRDMKLATFPDFEEWSSKHGGAK